MHHRPDQLAPSLVASVIAHALALLLIVLSLPDMPATQATLIVPTLRLKSPPPAPVPDEQPSPEPPAPPLQEPPPQRQPEVPEKPPEPTPDLAIPNEPPPAPKPEPPQAPPDPPKQEPPSTTRHAQRSSALPRAPAQSANTATSSSPGLRARPFLAPNPPYPASARRDGAEGEVLVAASIDPAGLVTAVSVSRSSGRDDLDAAASDTVLHRWRFRPATRAGRPIHSRETVLVRFVLEE